MRKVFSELSVYTANYNHGVYIFDKIHQIINQSVWPREYIIVDDCSTDDSWDIIQSVCNDYTWIKCYRNDKNIGVINCMNKALSLSTCSLFYGTASDDIIDKDSFEIIQSFYNKHPNVGIIFSSMYEMNKSEKIVKKHEPLGFSSSILINSESFFSNYLSKQTARFSLGTATYFNKDALLSIGGFQKDLNSLCDTAAINTIGLNHGCYYFKSPLTTWRKIERGFSQTQNSDIHSLISNVHNTAHFYKNDKSCRSLSHDYINMWSKDFILDAFTEQILANSSNFTKNSIFLNEAYNACKKPPASYYIDSNNLERWKTKYEILIKK